MPEWELHPFDNYPQTPEIYLDQIQQELDAILRRRIWLVEEWHRVRDEIERLKSENPDAG